MQPMTPETPATRLRKIVTKDIGILYYGLPQSGDPHSVLYSQIMESKDWARSAKISDCVR
ncbi:MAG TPA: hypothetical protein VIX37_22670 [Candidatus Sulfotelmatobacter sp.]